MPSPTVKPTLQMADACLTIRELQASRRHCIRNQTRLNNSLGAMARRLLGWRMDLPEKERAEIAKNAAKLIKSLADGEDHAACDTHAGAVLTPFVAATEQSRAPFDNMRKQIEAEMKKLVRQLPGYEFAEGVRGFGDLGFAVIIGEAGDLSMYPNPAKLWKRLGWAPPDTYEKGETGGAMIPRQRKAEIYACVGEPMLKHQWKAEKDDVPGHPVGPYGKIWADKKATYLQMGRTKLHAQRAATRVMIKSLLRDLWVAWNEASHHRSVTPERCAA